MYGRSWCCRVFRCEPQQRVALEISGCGYIACSVVNYDAKTCKRRSTMHQGASVADVSDSDGRSIAEIKLVDTRGGVPSLRVRQVESYQRPLVSETYAQEVLLLTERRGNVRRTRESWPKTKEAYVITWDQDVTGSDGREILLSCVGFWLDNGRGGGWTLNGIAPRGQLDGSALWDLVFSVRLP